MRHRKKFQQIFVMMGMSWKMPVLIRRLVIIVSLPVATSCMATHENIGDDPIVADLVVSQFLNGSIDLPCDVSCSGRWGANRLQAKQFYNSKDWTNLSKIVLKISHNVDLSWFYLGTSAEGLGFAKTSVIYYRKSLSTILKCDSFLFNNCDGIVVPYEAKLRLRNLNAEVN